jgi:hypothetical protein
VLYTEIKVYYNVQLFKATIPLIVQRTVSLQFHKKLPYNFSAIKMYILEYIHDRVKIHFSLDGIKHIS